MLIQPNKVGKAQQYLFERHLGRVELDVTRRVDLRHQPGTKIRNTVSSSAPHSLASTTPNPNYTTPNPQNSLAQHNPILQRLLQPPTREFLPRDALDPLRGLLLAGGVVLRGRLCRCGGVNKGGE